MRILNEINPEDKKFYYEVKSRAIEGSDGNYMFVLKNVTIVKEL